MDKEKKIYYVMGHTIDPTIIPDSVEDEEAFVRPVDADPTVEDLEYEVLYNAYTYLENMKFEAKSNSGGGGGGGETGGVTKEQMEQAIQAALDSIDLIVDPDDAEGDAYVLKVGSRTGSAKIEDKYLTGVDTESEPGKALFTISNDGGSISVDLSDLENDPVIDLDTF